MEHLSTLLTDYILEKEVINKEDYEIYQYGFQIGIEILIFIVVCYIMAIQLHMVGDCTVLLLILFLLRSYVGGIHMDSYIICFLCSCIVVFGTLMIRKYCPLEPFKATIISLLEVLMMYCMIPVENENRPVDDAEKQMFRRIINRILLGIALVILGGFIVGFYRYLSIITYTLGIIIISMFLGRLKCSYFNLPKNKKLK